MADDPHALFAELNEVHAEMLRTNQRMLDTLERLGAKTTVDRQVTQTLAREADERAARHASAAEET